MSLLSTRKYTAAILAITMLASSAASAAPAPPPTSVSPYVALSQLSTPGSAASVAAVSGGSTVAAATGSANVAQSYDSPRGSMVPLWVALAVVFAGWAWILLDDDDDNDEVSTPVSP